jgi:hypothetical protein
MEARDWRTGRRAFDAELYGVRGEILLVHKPANPARADKAFQTAVAIGFRLPLLESQFVAS